MESFNFEESQPADFGDSWRSAYEVEAVGLGIAGGCGGLREGTGLLYAECGGGVPSCGERGVRVSFDLPVDRLV